MELKDIFQNTKETIKKLIKPEMGEMSKSGTDIWGIGNLPIYNPDDLVEKKGLEIGRLPIPQISVPDMDISPMSGLTNFFIVSLVF